MGIGFFPGEICDQKFLPSLLTQNPHIKQR